MAETSKNVKMMLVLPNNDQESLVNAINYNFHQLANIANGVVAKKGDKGDPGSPGIQGAPGKPGQRGSKIYSYDGKEDYDTWRESVDISEDDYIITLDGIIYKYNEDYHSISEYKPDDVATNIGEDIAESVIKIVGAKSMSPFTTYESEIRGYHYTTQKSYNSITNETNENQDKYPIPVVLTSGFANAELTEDIFSGDGVYNLYSINSICGVGAYNIRLAQVDFKNYSTICFKRDCLPEKGILKFFSKKDTTCSYEFYSGDEAGIRIASLKNDSLEFPENYTIKFTNGNYIKSQVVKNRTTASASTFTISTDSELLLKSQGNLSSSINISSNVITNTDCNTFVIQNTSENKIFEYTGGNTKKINIGGNDVNAINVNGNNIWIKTLNASSNTNLGCLAIEGRTVRLGNAHSSDKDSFSGIRISPYDDSNTNMSIELRRTIGIMNSSQIIVYGGENVTEIKDDEIRLNDITIKTYDDKLRMYYNGIDYLNVESRHSSGGIIVKSGDGATFNKYKSHIADYAYGGNTTIAGNVNDSISDDIKDAYPKAFSDYDWAYVSNRTSTSYYTYDWDLSNLYGYNIRVYSFSKTCFIKINSHINFSGQQSDTNLDGVINIDYLMFYRAARLYYSKDTSSDNLLTKLVRAIKNAYKDPYVSWFRNNKPNSAWYSTLVNDKISGTKCALAKLETDWTLKILAKTSDQNPDFDFYGTLCFCWA